MLSPRHPEQSLGGPDAGLNLIPPALAITLMSINAVRNTVPVIFIATVIKPSSGVPATQLFLYSTASQPARAIPAPVSRGDDDIPVLKLQELLIHDIAQIITLVARSISNKLSIGRDNFTSLLVICDRLLFLTYILNKVGFVSGSPNRVFIFLIIQRAITWSIGVMFLN